MKKVFLFFLSSAIRLLSSAQDINFSQFYELPLLRNPAIAGLFTGDIRVTGVFRNQWNSVTVPYQTTGLSGELKFTITEADYLAVGIQLTNDVAGDSKLGRTALLPTLTFHKSINGDKDSYLSLGFSGGAVRQRFNNSKLRFDDQFVNGAYSPTNPTRQTFSNGAFNTEMTYYDANVGLLYSSVFGNDIRYYIGGSYFHFTQPKVAFSALNDVRLNGKVMINAGLSAPVSEYDKLILYTDVFTQGGSRQVQGGLLWKHDIEQEDDDQTFGLSGGVFTRWGDAVMPVLKLDYYKWSLGFTYDINISKLSTASGGKGAMELTASFRDFLPIRNSSAQKVRCPVGL